MLLFQNERKSKMSREKPLFDIFISVYNLEKYIGACLDSVLKQDFDDYVITLVDNGSVDRSIEICLDYAKKFPSIIQYIQLKPSDIRGLTYLYGQAHCRGNYFVNIDGDDFLVDGCLKKIAKLIEEKQADMIIGTYLSLAEDSSIPTITDGIYDADLANTADCSKAIDYLFSIPRFHPFLWRYVIKKDVLPFHQNIYQMFLKNLSLFSAQTEGDTWMVPAIWNQIESISFLKEPFYIYRRRSGSATTSQKTGKSCIGLLFNLMNYKLYWANCKKQVQKRNIKRLIYETNEMRVFFILHYLTFLEEKDYIEFAAMVEKNRTLFASLREEGIAKLTLLVNMVEKYSAERGLKVFAEQEKKRFLQQVQNTGKTNIYLFPSGNCAEATVYELKKSGYCVKGFLDNDKQKDGLLFQGIPCFLPEKLKLLPQEEKENLLFIVDTSYEKLRIILSKQLNDMGFLNEQILVRNLEE